MTWFTWQKQRSGCGDWEEKGVIFFSSVMDGHRRRLSPPALSQGHASTNCLDSAVELELFYSTLESVYMRDRRVSGSGEPIQTSSPR